MSSRDDKFPEVATRSRPRFVPPDRPGFVVAVVDGPDQGRQLEIGAGSPPFFIGKGPACQLSLSDPEVSRRHLSLELADADLRIRDLDSTNGTFVNGLRAREVFAVGGESIRVGSTTLRVTKGAATTAASSTASGFGRVLGESPAMRRIYPLCERLAAAAVPVVVEGETGTGKEQLAEALHEQGPRADASFVVFDCTAIAPNLIESELFGHEKGAFTGAVGARQGVFERAHGGTLLIDEIGDLPLELQPKLLRAIERMTVTRVGGDRPLRVDVRLIVATRRDLDHEVEAGRFRDDLYHRLVVGRVELPPLRMRQGDVRLLARAFATAMGASPDVLPPDVLERWADYGWPGNVRELRNAVARRLALGDLSQADREPPQDAGERERIGRGGDAVEKILALDLPLSEAKQRMLEELETRYVERALEQSGGNVTRAAALAGVSRRYLQRLKQR